MKINQIVNKNIDCLIKWNNLIINKILNRNKLIINNHHAVVEMNKYIKIRIFTKIY